MFLLLDWPQLQKDAAMAAKINCRNKSHFIFFFASFFFLRAQLGHVCTSLKGVRNGEAADIKTLEMASSIKLEQGFVLPYDFFSYKGGMSLCLGSKAQAKF